MTTIDFLTPQNVILDAKAADKDAVLRLLAQKAASVSDLSDETIYQALVKREQLGCTGVGSGIALPHARIVGLPRVIGCFLRLARPVAYEAIDGKPVDLVFLLLLPETGGGNLPILAAVARLLRDPDKAKSLRAAKDARALYVLLSHGAAQG
jgi:PTS system nitrogen regulatory IIA component